MNITPILAPQVQANKAVKFGCKEEKPLVDIPQNAPDDAVAFYSNWGDNYAYPVTVGEMKALEELKTINAVQAAEAAQKAGAEHQAGLESPEEYYDRKLFSPEWFM